MTEQEWRECTNPLKMLDILKGKVSDRKLRLFAVACCWRVGHLLSAERMRGSVEAAERFADGLTSPARLNATLTDVDIYEWLGGVDDVVYLVTRPPHVFGVDMAARLVRRASHVLGRAAYPDADITHDAYLGAASVRDREAEAQADLLRCVFGSWPFRSLTAHPSWRTWHGSLLVSMAQQMYDSRDFNDMPVLADALEDAGCDNADILNHLRGPGPHCRGCWVLDLLTGRE
jgi:hypothetical protein